MISNVRSIRNFRNPIGFLILLVAFAAAAGCSTAETTGGSATNLNHVLPSGSSVSGWLVAPSGGTHASTATLDYIANSGSSGCAQCHGSDLTGGIAGVSCFQRPKPGFVQDCHHGSFGGVWDSPAIHGPIAKAAPGNGGFASCMICHGNDYTGGGSNVTCLECHFVVFPYGEAPPHGNKPWLAAAGSGFTHTDTDPANAPACYQCHAYSVPKNPRNPHQPPFPAAAGTAPGCSNGTMCHNETGHPAGWNNPAQHGFKAKQDPATGGQGFSNCQACHGTDFTGGFVGVSCFVASRDGFNCHTSSRTQVPPHSRQPWRASGGSAYSHTLQMSPANAPVCYGCHAAGSPYNPANHPPPGQTPGTSPDCFNGSMCHFQVGHNKPYFDNVHFKATATTFLDICQNCHVKSGAEPTDNTAAPPCSVCHNNIAIAGSDPLVTKDCTSCHGKAANLYPSLKYTGMPVGGVTAYPNVGGAHQAHMDLDSTGTPLACPTCHNGIDNGTLAHYQNAYGRTNNIYPKRSSPGATAFTATYRETTTAGIGFGTIGATLLACSNVSCHGGQATPNWQNGAIDPNVDSGPTPPFSGCRQCHNYQSPASNGPTSGEHAKHLGQGIRCTECHNMQNGSPAALNHFKNLGIPGIQGTPSQTVVLTVTSGTAVYNPGAAGGPNCTSSTFSCHGQGHDSGDTWQ